MRLINADELEEEVSKFFLAITGNPKQATIVRECKKSFEQMIEDQPTVFNLGEVVDLLEEEAIEKLGISKEKLSMDKGEYASSCSLSLNDVLNIIQKGLNT